MVSRLFLVLAVLSGVVAAVGFVWAVVAGGRGLRDQVSGTGATMAAGSASSWAGPGSGKTDQAPGEADTGEPAVLASGTEASGGFSLADAGRLLRAGHGRRALPGLLLGGGLLGLLLFGALSLLTSLPSKWLGLAALAIAVIIALGELRGFLTTRG